MSLQALKIVEEEYKSFLDGFVRIPRPTLLRVEALCTRIVARIASECIEQPGAEGQPMHARCLQRIDGAEKNCMLSFGHAGACGLAKEVA